MINLYDTIIIKAAPTVDVVEIKEGIILVACKIIL